MKLLSICVPTLNRSKTIEQLLASLFRQVTPEISELLELCINDDSVDDSTEEVVKKYIARGEVDIVYHRNHGNTGLERAFLESVELSGGKFAWIMSDDDLFIDGGIKIVLEHLQTDEYDFMVIESNNFDERHGWENTAIYSIKDAVYDNATEYARVMDELVIPMTQVCVCIYRRTFWDTFNNKEEDITYKYFPHMKRIYDALPHSKRKTIAVSAPIINTRAYGQNYTKDVLIIWYHDLYRIVESNPAYAPVLENVRHTISQKAPFRDIKQLRRLIASKLYFGILPEGVYRVNYAVYKTIRKNLTSKERVTMFAVVATPSVVLKIGRKFKNIIAAIREKRAEAKREKSLKKSLSENTVIAGNLLLAKLRNTGSSAKKTDGNYFSTDEKLKVAMITPWNTKCGIAEYSGMLCEDLAGAVDFEIFPARDNELVRADEEFVQPRLWCNMFDGSLADLLNALKNSECKILHFQNQYGFFDLKTLTKMITELHNKKIIITMHRTAKMPLCDIADGLNLCAAVIVHSALDRKRLTESGVDDKLIKEIPLGQPEFPQEDAQKLRQSMGLKNKLIMGSYGFLMPHKGVLECIRAVAVIRQKVPDVLYIISCAVYPNAPSKDYFFECLNEIKIRNLEENIIVLPDFLPNEESSKLLQASDILLMPYKNTDESASGAIRFCVAAKKPIIATAQPIFDEFEGCCIKIPECTPENIAAAVEQLAKDKKLCNRLAENINIRIAETSREATAKKYYEVYYASL
ncbi:MAG: glycosyltransferase [Defluviitaleaceae bacterium]|nr:glycosyltransferase [Defluviitaleaceae bacterium]